MIKGVVFGLVFWIVTGLFGFQQITLAMLGDAKKHTMFLAFKAPEFDGHENWVNSSGYGSMKELRGKVVLINLWTSSCISCVHAFSHVQGWYEAYKNKGLAVIGVHPPEFGTARDMEDLIWTAKNLGLTFPIVQDNEFKLWRKYGNRIWPAIFLIDKHGEVRYSQLGKGNYQKTEFIIKKLLSE